MVGVGPVGWGSQGGCEPRIEVIVKNKKGKVGGRVRVVGGGCPVGGGSQGGCERRIEVTVQATKRLYPSRSCSNKKGIKFLAKPTQNPRKFLAKSKLLPCYFHAYSSLDSASCVRFHACSTFSKKKITLKKKNSRS